MPLLETTDQMSYLCHELRSEAFSVWGELIKTASKLPNGQQTSTELLVTFLDKVTVGSEKEEDAETITEVARGIQKAYVFLRINHYLFQKLKLILKHPISSIITTFNTSFIIPVLSK